MHDGDDEDDNDNNGDELVNNEIMKNPQAIKMKRTSTIFLLSIFLFAFESYCEEDDESERLMDNETIQNFIRQLVGLVNQGTSALVGSNGLSGLQGIDGYQRPIDSSNLDYPDRQFGQNGVDYPVPYPYPARPPTQRPYPLGSYQQQSLFGALYSISQYDDLRCVPRLLCEVTAGTRPGGPYYGSYYGQNQQPSILPFLSKESLVTILTVLNFVDESPFLVFGRAALLGYTTRGDPRQCLTAYPLCPRNPDQLVDYLNNHNGGFFRFFNQQLPHIPQYAPFYQNNYQNLQGNYQNLQGINYPNGLYNKQPYRKLKKFTKLYDTENGKKYPNQYAEKEPKVLRRAKDFVWKRDG
ncbi:hypothetical protein WDU94_009713 [Cyamophila willieti]